MESSFRLAGGSAFFWFLVVVLALASGCGENGGEPTVPDCSWPSGLRKPETPADVVRNLCVAFEHRNPAWLDSSLYDSSTAEDPSRAFELRIGRYPHWAHWNRGDLLRWFSDAVLATVSEGAQAQVTPRSLTRDSDPEHQGEMLMVFDTMRVALHVRDPVSGDLTTVARCARGGVLRFKVQRVDACGDSLWRLIDWEFASEWLDWLPAQRIARSPEDVLYNLQQAYRFKKTAWYDSLLYDADASGDLTEEYRFRFAEGDHAPSTWARSDDVDATNRLFAATRVEDVTIDLAHGGSVPTNQPGHEGQREILVTDVYLNVEDRDPDTGDLTEYRVDDDQSYFRFKAQWVNAAGDTLWRIVYWEDRGRRMQAPDTVAQKTTWGKVKAMFERAP